MIEPEMPFADLGDTMNLGEEFLKNLIRYSIKNRFEDHEFLDKIFIEEENAKGKRTGAT